MRCADSWSWPRRAEAGGTAAGETTGGGVGQVPVHLPGQAELDHAGEQVVGADHGDRRLLQLELAAWIREDDDGADDLPGELGVPRGEELPHRHRADSRLPAVALARPSIDGPLIAVALDVACAAPDRDDDDATRPDADVIDTADIVQEQVVDEVVVVRQLIQQPGQALVPADLPHRPQPCRQPGAHAERDQQGHENEREYRGGMRRGESRRRPEAGGHEEDPDGDHDPECRPPPVPLHVELYAALPKNLHSLSSSRRASFDGTVIRAPRRTLWTWRFSTSPMPHPRRRPPPTATRCASASGCS